MSTTTAPEAPTLRVTLVSWEPRPPTGALRGYAAVKLRNGLTIRQCSVGLHQSGSAWASPPARPLFDANGERVVTSAGRGRFATLVDFESPEQGQAFSRAVVEAVLAEYPDALDPTRSAPLEQEPTHD